MSIEQRAHEAAMAHLASLGVRGSQEAADAYQAVYQALAPSASAGKIQTDAIYLEVLYQQGMRQANNLDIALNEQLRIDNNYLGMRAKVAEQEKKSAHLGNICNMAVCAMGGFAVAMILVWLK